MSEQVNDESLVGSCTRFSNTQGFLSDMSPDACFTRPGPEWLPRLMVIDGCNIGRSSCGITREAVSCAGLLSVVRWLLLRDIECIVFLPVVYNNSFNNNTTHVHLLSKMEEAGLVTFTPARASNGDRRAFINYDDLYALTMAERHGGCVLSGDKFKDILTQPQYRSFHELIQSRVLDLKFLFLPHEVVHFGDDVFYKAAPELFLFEPVETRARAISRIIHAHPSDPDFTKVANRRPAFSAARRQRIRICDDLLYELCERESIRPMRMHQLPEIRRNRVVDHSSSSLTPAAIDQWSQDDSEWHGQTQSEIVLPPASNNNINPQVPEGILIDFNDDSTNTDVVNVADEVDTLVNDFSNALTVPINCHLVVPQYKNLDGLPVNRRSVDDMLEGVLSSPVYDRPSSPVPAELEHSITEFTLAPTDDVISSTPATLLPLQVEGSPSTYLPPTVHMPQPIESPISTLGANSELLPVPRAADQHDVDERRNLESSLCALFPRDVVLSVLTMNASSNLDFLAERCLELLEVH